MTRLLSYSEIATAMECQAKWDFTYGDQLAGSSLRPTSLAPILSMGRAWGAAVAAFHVAVDLRDTQTGQLELFREPVPAPDVAAELALLGSLAADAAPQKEAGTWREDQHLEMAYRGQGLLEHYIATAKPLALEALEARYEEAIPSRAGGRASTKYRLVAFVDGRSVAREGPWLVEFKLRGDLMPVEFVIRSRQIRWYAWAHWRATGERPVGVIVDERLNAVPKPPRVLASGKVSHAKDQLTTPDWYARVCREHGEEPKLETFESLGARRWQQRVPVIFRPGELEEAGLELTAGGRMIGELDRGAYPIRNAKRATCQSCQFRQICDNPKGDEVDEFFTRVPAKRDREGAAA